jgi:hypothetical protein
MKSRSEAKRGVYLLDIQGRGYTPFLKDCSATQGIRGRSNTKVAFGASNGKNKAHAGIEGIESDNGFISGVWYFIKSAQQRIL